MAKQEKKVTDKKVADQENKQKENKGTAAADVPDQPLADMNE